MTSPKTEHMPVFNEAKLREEIVRIWGQYGAHMEIFEMIQAERNRLLALNAELVEALGSILTVSEIRKADHRLRVIEITQAALEKAQRRGE